ncbi:MAG: hypothetical protein NZ532_03920 [Thermoflexales bacterium]|nr:hypothetical protein [Thermoflexales bacterium]
MWLLPLFLIACSRATGDSIARTIVERFGNSLVATLIGAILALIAIATLVNSVMQMLEAWDGESNNHAPHRPKSVYDAGCGVYWLELPISQLRD